MATKQQASWQNWLGTTLVTAGLLKTPVTAHKSAQNKTQEINTLSEKLYNFTFPNENVKFWTLVLEDSGEIPQKPNGEVDTEALHIHIQPLIDWRRTNPKGSPFYSTGKSTNRWIEHHIATLDILYYGLMGKTNPPRT